MPNRVIRDGWLDSARIDKLDAHAERFLLRLMLRADDFGRYHANPQLLKSMLFPLRDDIRNTDIARCLAACEEAGLVRTFESKGGRYLYIVDFRQRTRAIESKFPAPPSDDGHPPGTCQTLDSQPRTYSETETEASADAGASARGRQVRGSMPASLDALGEPFRLAWESWLVDLTQRKYGRPPTNHQCHLHLVTLAKIAEAGGNPIAAINNAIAKGLLVPCLPFDGQKTVKRDPEPTTITLTAEDLAEPAP